MVVLRGRDLSGLAILGVGVSSGSLIELQRRGVPGQRQYGLGGRNLCTYAWGSDNTG